MKKFTFAIILLVCSNIALAGCGCKSVNLKQFIKANPDIGKTHSSERISPLTGTDITIGKTTYQIRMFFFEDTKKATSEDFSTFAKNHKLLALPSKKINNGYGDLVVISTPKSLQKEGFHFLVSLRPVANSA